VNYNGVTGVGRDVDATLARVRAWGVPARWILGSASLPDGYEAGLSERGLTMFDESPGMVARIDDLPAPALKGCTVEVARDEVQREAFFDVFRDAFGLDAGASQNVRAAHDWSCLTDPSRTYLLIRRRGEPVATGLLRWTGGDVAGVYGIAVRRAFQRQGLGALATLLTVREGARRGARIAILQATSDGFPVYARLGFHAICSFRSWRIT
jgi:GNAT superfamily N-acetyltransferase